MATEHLSLPGVVHLVFSSVIDTVNSLASNQATASSAPWHVWQRVLKVKSTNGDFLSRLYLIQAAVVHLRQEVNAIPVGELTANTKRQWLGAIDHLNNMTDVTKFHERMQEWSSKASPNDLSI